MKRLILQIIILLMLVNIAASQTYEIFFEDMPEDPYASLFEEPYIYDYNKYMHGNNVSTYNSFGNYSWSCDGRWLYFSVDKKIVEKKRLNNGEWLVSNYIINKFFVAGPFGADNSIVKIKYIGLLRSEGRNGKEAKNGKILVSPDNKKIAFLGSPVIIKTYNVAVTSFNEFENEHFDEWETSTELTWSPNSEFLYPSTYSLNDEDGSLRFYSCSNNKVITIDKSPLSLNNEYSETMKNLCLYRNSLAKKKKDYKNCDSFYHYNLKGKATFTDEYFYLKIDYPVFKLGRNKEGVLREFVNPMHNNTYRFSKINGRWEETDYFPSEKPCSYNASVTIEAKEDISQSGEVKGDWGQTEVGSVTAKSYKLIFKKQ